MEDPKTPFNTFAEQATLGSCLYDRDAIALIEPFLTAEDFYHETHRWIFQAMLGCQARRVPTDFITVGAVLEDLGQIAAVGGISGLIDLTQVVPTSYHVQWYARIVRDKSGARLLIEVGRDLAALGYDSPERDELLAKAQRVYERIHRPDQTSDIHWLSDVSREYERHLESARPPRVATGLRDLDKILVGGFRKTAMVTVAARTSIGKTAFALQVALNVAKRGETVLFLSLESGRIELQERLIAAESGIDSTRIALHEDMTEDEFVRHIAANGLLSSIPLGIMEEKDVHTVSALRSAVLRMIAERGEPAIIFIDYLNLLTPENQRKNGNRTNDVSDLSRACKQLAGVLNCPVVTLAQLSRGIENRQDGVPRLSDLRESGSIEQDSDVVLFLDRETSRDPKSTRHGEVDVWIAKQRQGPLGKVTLQFQPETGRFRDLATYPPPAGYGGPR